jgi:large subunit ribosomal protein L22
MQVEAVTKYARMSPKKVREVTRGLRGLKANEALEKLKCVPRKSARLVAKTLQSAVANAENNRNLSSDDLIVDTAVVDRGPVLKRWRAGARGMVKRIEKRMSHIRIVLSDE